MGEDGEEMGREKEEYQDERFVISSFRTTKYITGKCNDYEYEYDVAVGLSS